ncbi:MAG: hypothetical protein MZV70_35805 [Desulfobacterales bacterium]|nr:hypothetical protein [Desulfobacterales bacterium]
MALELLKEIELRYPGSSLSVTGSNGKVIASALGIKPVNEIVSQAYAVKRLYPAIRTLIELGGEDSKLIILDDGRIKDFAMNSVCAAGTRIFPRAAGGEIETDHRGVQRNGGPVREALEDSGALQRLRKIGYDPPATDRDTCRGHRRRALFRRCKELQGDHREGDGPRTSRGIPGRRRCKRRYGQGLQGGLRSGGAFVPPDFALMGAIGAALKDLDEGRRTALDTGAIESYVSAVRFEDAGQQPLLAEGDDFFDRHERPERQERHAGDWTKGEERGPTSASTSGPSAPTLPSWTKRERSWRNAIS